MPDCPSQPGSGSKMDWHPVYRQRLPKEEARLILTVLLLAALLRFGGITFDSLWLDEGYQTLASSVGQRLPDFTAIVDQPYLFHFGPPRSLAELILNFRQVDPLCPPLYPVLLNRWMSLFGESDLAIRSLSALFSLSSILAVFWLTRLLFGAGPALFAALLQAVSPFDIHYAQEARMYSLTILLSSLSCATFFKLLGTRRLSAKTWATLFVYAGSTWALINSHYTALFIPLFQALFGLWSCLKRRDWLLFFTLAASWTTVFLFWLPWLDMFRQAASVRGGSFYVSRAPSWWWPLSAFLARVPLNWIVFLAGKRVVAYAVPIYVTSFSFLALALMWTLPQSLRQSFLKRLPESVSALEVDFFRADGPTTSERSMDHSSGTNSHRAASGASIVHKTNATAFAWCWAVLPALFVLLVDVVENRRLIEVSRYLSATAPAIYMLAAVGLAGMMGRQAVRGTKPGYAAVLKDNAAGPMRLAGHRFSTAMAGGIILTVHALFALLNNAYAHAVPQREPWREMAAAVESYCLSEDLILVSQYYDLVCLDRYLTTPVRQVGVSPSQGPNHILRVLSAERRFWLVTAQEGEAVKDMIPARFRAVRELNFSHGLHLRLYEAASP